MEFEVNIGKGGGRGGGSKHHGQPSADRASRWGPKKLKRRERGCQGRSSTDF